MSHDIASLEIIAIDLIIAHTEKVRTDQLKNVTRLAGCPNRACGHKLHPIT